jgi:hypothetical protein
MNGNPSLDQYTPIPHRNPSENDSLISALRQLDHPSVWLEQFCSTHDDETFKAILQLPKDGTSQSDND